LTSARIARPLILSAATGWKRSLGRYVTTRSAANHQTIRCNATASADPVASSLTLRIICRSSAQRLVSAAGALTIACEPGLSAAQLQTGVGQQSIQAEKTSACPAPTDEACRSTATISRQGAVSNLYEPILSSVGRT
jgi:hypothetical protein